MSINNISQFKYKGSYHIGFFEGKKFHYEIITDKPKAVARYKELKDAEKRGN
jgi:hypothetical protein